MTKDIKTFRDLIAWRKGMELAKRIYQITQSMPSEEKFGLTAQMRRAAISIPSNIAEGYGRHSRVDYIRFLKTARGSLMELQTQLILCNELGLIPIPAIVEEMSAETDRVLQALIRSLETLPK